VVQSPIAGVQATLAEVLAAGRRPSHRPIADAVLGAVAGYLAAKVLRRRRQARKPAQDLAWRDSAEANRWPRSR
jgi:hypothetical protein